MTSFVAMIHLIGGGQSTSLRQEVYSTVHGAMWASVEPGGEERWSQMEGSYLPSAWRFSALMRQRRP